MCIRDRRRVRHVIGRVLDRDRNARPTVQRQRGDRQVQRRACLLYTSDAADERSSVDLGGRRIIKKKKKER